MTAKKHTHKCLLSIQAKRTQNVKLFFDLWRWYLKTDWCIHNRLHGCLIRSYASNSAGRLNNSPTVGTESSVQSTALATPHTSYTSRNPYLLRAMDLNAPHYTEDCTQQFLVPVILSQKPHNVFSHYSSLGTCSSFLELVKKHSSVRCHNWTVVFYDIRAAKATVKKKVLHSA